MARVFWGFVGVAIVTLAIRLTMTAQEFTFYAEFIGVGR